jgi:hypothetical protein
MLHTSPNREGKKISLKSIMWIGKLEVENYVNNPYSLFKKMYLPHSTRSIQLNNERQECETGHVKGH